MGSMRSGLQGLFHHDFEDDEMKAFSTQMSREISVLETQGHKMFEKRDITVKFMTATNMQMKTSCMNDIPKYHLKAESVSMAVNSKQVERLPWETLLYGDGDIPGFPMTLKVPEKVVTPFINVRKACNNLLGSSTLSLAKMIQVVKANFDKMKGYDKAWILEHTFLLSYVEPLLKEQIEAGIMNAFQVPIANNPCTLR